jgi:hypothetical protein
MQGKLELLVVLVHHKPRGGVNSVDDMDEGLAVVVVVQSYDDANINQILIKHIFL